MIIGQKIYTPTEDLFAGFPLELLVVNAEPVTIDSTPLPVVADQMILDEAVELDDTEYLVRVAAFLQGDSTAESSQLVRGVIYTDAGDLVAAGEDIIVNPGDEPVWISLTFPDHEGMPLKAGEYRFGLQAGVVDGAAEYFIGLAGGSRTTYDATFTDGAPATLPSGTTTAIAAVFFLETLGPVIIPSDVTDDYLATLPFDVTQNIFLASAAIPSTQVSAIAGWYSTKFDPTTGANAIVRSDGPLADLVGERIVVTHRGAIGDRRVAVYVHDERTFPDEIADEDLVLTARAFLAIGSQTLDDLDVEVAILG